MKKTVIILMILTFVFSGFSSMEIQAAEEISVTLHAEKEHPKWDVVERFKETVEEETDGEFEVVLLGLEVGGERDHVEGVSAGEYTMSLGGSVPLDLYAPEFKAVDLPFLFENTDQAKGVYEGERLEILNETLIENGDMRLVGLLPRTPRYLTSKEPVRTLEDVSGGMRVPEIQPWVDVWSELGADPEPIPADEMYLAIQTGVVDMQENPVEFTMSQKIHEVNDYITKTAHIHSFFHWLMNEDFYQNLSDENREIIMNAIEEANEWGEEYIFDREEDQLEGLVEDGYIKEVIEVDFEEWQEAAMPAVEPHIEELHPTVREYLDSLEN
ncbi:MAG: TRAP transporter substrate-binding protein [bacterium]